MKAILRTVICLSLVGLGLYGLHTEIPYSGWILFVGLLVALGA